MTRDGAGRILLVAMVTLGALLGFGLQPMIGRVLAASYGTSVKVWLSSMVFFQGSLFAGYLYAHLVAPRIGRWHLAVLLVPFVFLPPLFAVAPNPDAPAFEVFSTLIRYVLAPFAIVSTTAVVSQLWLASSDLEDRVDPYPLYASSNVGSLLGLLGYPLLLERISGVRVQSWLWSGSYLAYVAVVAAVWFVLKPDPRRLLAHHEADDGDAPAGPTPAEMAVWLLLAAFPSGLLISTTNVIASEVGSFPLIWVMPLAVYLGTFIACFRDNGDRLRWLAVLIPETALAGFVAFRFDLRDWWLAVLHLIVLAVVALAAHAELFHRRPHPRHLTTFFLTVAFGGWMGGLITNALPPVVFIDFSEHAVLLAGSAVLLTALGFRQIGALHDRFGLPLVAARGVAIAVLGTLTAAAIQTWFSGDEIDAYRNFYGRFEVQERTVDGRPMRLLMHGTTLHGVQSLEPDNAMEPLSYFHKDGCIARTYATLPEGPRRIAVLGLGAGVTTVFTDADDTMRFYEIDPDNERIARKWFTYLDDAPAREVDVVVGDGRLRLAAALEKYDLIHLDAFSGDGIPFHLLTTEAIRDYADHLTDDGILLFHVSNRFFDLRPVLKANAAALGLSGRFNGRMVSGRGMLAVPAACVVLAGTDTALARLTDERWYPLEGGFRDVAPWTDDYVDMWAAFDGQGSNPDVQADGR